MSGKKLQQGLLLTVKNKIQYMVERGNNCCERDNVDHQRDI